MFWLDWWTGRGPLRELFPTLFAWCEDPYATVAEVRTIDGWHIRFRRPFGLVESVEWDNMSGCATYTRPNRDRM